MVYITHYFLFFYPVGIPFNREKKVNQAFRKKKSCKFGICVDSGLLINIIHEKQLLSTCHSFKISYIQQKDQTHQHISGIQNKTRAHITLDITAPPHCRRGLIHFSESIVKIHTHFQYDVVLVKMHSIYSLNLLYQYMVIICWSEVGEQCQVASLHPVHGTLEFRAQTL